MWIQTSFTVRKRLSWVLTSCDLDLWPLTLNFCMDVTFVIGNNPWKFHDDMMMGTWRKRCDGRTDGPMDRRTDGLNQSYSCLVAAKNYRAPLLHYTKLCTSSQTTWWIQTGVIVRKRSIQVKIWHFLSCVTLKFDGLPWKTIGHLFWATSKLCASFHSHWWIQTGVTVRKRPIWIQIDDF